MRNGPLALMLLVFGLGMLDDELGHSYDWRASLVEACSWLTSPFG
jgi:hypothetical protein